MTKQPFLFASKPGSQKLTSIDSDSKSWKVLIIDDEQDVHSVTKLVLRDFIFDGRKLEFFSAFSADEAIKLLKKHPDTALALVDVVMEHEHAGLELVRHIRQKMKYHAIRLVLRTGQPGQAPEKQVISEYDINDYKNKTELTDTKLHTLLFSALRSYRDIITLEKNKLGLERVIKASAQVFEVNSLRIFVNATLAQLTNLLGVEDDAAQFKGMESVAVTPGSKQFKVRAGTGKFETLTDSVLDRESDPEMIERLTHAARLQQNVYGEDYLITYFKTSQGEENLLYIKPCGELSELDQQLIEIFCSNVAIAFENAQLKQEIEDTQSEIIYLLGEAVENRSNETGNHVKRVAAITELLALACGFDELEAASIKAASPLHDLGKIAIADDILHKPGRHNDQESEIMRSHVDIGYNMLQQSKRKILKYGAIIAQQHHERWDGTGYPQQLKGQDIDLIGRIAAVADVFDALMNKRCYKPAWSLQQTMEYFEQQSGKHFDPTLVELLKANIQAVMEIQQRFQDPKQAP